MIFSYNWLKTYFENEHGMPPAKEVENGIIFHSFEVEGMEAKGDDFLLDIKVLPDRAHDCLCHHGLAGEISAIFDLKKRAYSADYGALKSDFSDEPGRSLEVKNICPDLCRRYIGRIVENISVGNSPDWLQERLQAIGQRSISNIVDATNYVMFDLGQPMHAFDADKVKGNITIRRAASGEKMVTLDGKELCLTEDQMVIADDEGPLALAGIKGGNRAEVDQNTKNIILESANFDPVNIRRTSAAVGIRTDASKRYENDFSPSIAETAMDQLSSLLYQIAGGEQLRMGNKIDSYPNPNLPRSISLSVDQVCRALGVDVPKETIVAILNRLDVEVSEDDGKLNLRIPARRVDLEGPENIVEEVGRIYGYEKIQPKLLNTQLVNTNHVADRKYRLSNKIRRLLIENGYSEVYGYAFSERGSIEVANPLALDKPFLRKNLRDWLKDKLLFNIRHVLFDTEAVKIFELGHVFDLVEGKIIERTNLVVGVAQKGVKQKIQEGTRVEMANIRKIIAENLLDGDENAKVLQGEEESEADNVLNVSSTTWEFDFDDLSASIDGDIENTSLEKFISDRQYKKVSAFPRIIRDIALWVPDSVPEIEVEKNISESGGQWLVEGPIQFDRFAKDGRVSLAFRLVFQSYEKTLSDLEVNMVMDSVISSLESKGWEVRK